MPSKEVPAGCVRILFIGDIIGKFGRQFLAGALPYLKSEYRPTLVIANGENSAGGLGIIRKTAQEIFDSGVQIITTGNHIWDKKEAVELLKEEKRVIRPLNFPSVTPGNGSCMYRLADQTEIIVINLQGRVFMDPVVDNPFHAIDQFLKSVSARIIFIDFHAEASAEKQALAFFLNGRASALMCTHTHVQTNDLRILSRGTAFQTDVGMTGSYDSVIGMKVDPIINRFLTGVNQRFEVAQENLFMDASVIDIEKNSGRAVQVSLIKLFEHEMTHMPSAGK